MKTLLTGTAVAAILLAGAVRAEDPAQAPVPGTHDQVRDRLHDGAHEADRARDRLHDAAADADRVRLHDQTRDQLRDPTRDQLRDQTRDQLRDGEHAGAADPLRERLRAEMHEAMLEHAPAPAGHPELPGRALADMERRHAGAQHEAAATRAAERHALRHGGDAAGTHHDGAGRPGMVPGGGMGTGAGPGPGGECGDAAGARRMMEMHGGDMGGGGHGGMMDGGGTGGMGGTGGTGGTGGMGGSGGTGGMR